jgi:3-dehydroquinate dehydratase
MGIGRFGSMSRILLARLGSRLVYTSLAEPLVEGQLSIERFRAVLRQVGRD